MVKPIISTTLSGLFVKSTPWKQAHMIWFEKASIQLNDVTIKDWSSRDDYFNGVDELSKRLFPELSEEERTIKSRQLFFDSVLENIQNNQDVRNEEIIQYFQKIKPQITLALVTTNDSSSINRILELVNLQNFFDIIETSKPEEKDDKRIVFERFISNHNQPSLYVGGEKTDTFNFCKEKNIPFIYVNLENNEEIQDAPTAHNVQELNELINKLFNT
jgi:phosphoglycolate phosphatase-like HAD superfamily hydrolase